MKRLFSLLFCVTLCLQFFGQSTESAGEMKFRVMTYNIHHGEGTDQVLDLDRQAEVINNAQPYVIGLQEVDSCVKRTNRIHQARVLANKTGMHATFGGAIPLTGGKYGVAILSKEQPLSYRNIPLPGVEKRTLLVCEFNAFVFATTHLDLTDSCRMLSLPIILEEAQRWDKPFFICGDWNDVPTSNIITKMKQANFRMLSYVTNASRYYTFPAGTPNKIIDYIACYGEGYKSRSGAKVLNESVASDHRPVQVDVTIDLPTGIASPATSCDLEEDDAFYDLSGRKWLPASCRLTLPKGVYINKGKKYVKP